MEAIVVSRDELQTFLDRKAGKFSFSTVDHLKWDLVSIFRLAVAEGCSRRNLAELLFTPREAKKPERLVLTLKEVNRIFELLELRERLIVKFAVLGGMRPGEIFALRRGGVRATSAEVKERLYRGDIDTRRPTNPFDWWPYPTDWLVILNNGWSCIRSAIGMRGCFHRNERISLLDSSSVSSPFFAAKFCVTQRVSCV